MQPKDQQLTVDCGRLSWQESVPEQDGVVPGQSRRDFTGKKSLALYDNFTSIYKRTKRFQAIEMEARGRH